MALRSRASEARAARAAGAQTEDETPTSSGGGSLADRRRRAVQPRGEIAKARQEAPAPTNAPVEDPPFEPDPAVPDEQAPLPPADEPIPAAEKPARKPRSDKGTKRAAPPEPESNNPSEWSAAQTRARMKEIEGAYKELVKQFEGDKKALSDEYAQLAVRLLEA